MLRQVEKVDPGTGELRARFHIDTPRPGLLDWLAPRVEATGRWIDVLLMEKRKWTRLPWRQRLRAWRHGFSSFSYWLYELESNNPREYLSDAAAIRFGCRPNGRYTGALFSKVAFCRMLVSLGAPQPPVLGVSFRGRFYPESGTACDALAGIHALLEQGLKLVLRPSHGGGGAGILILERNTEGYRVNGIATGAQTLERLIRLLHDYMITRWVEQAAYAAEIFPGATNTLRILTLWDCALNAPFIAAASHRFGRATAGPLDGFHAGYGGLSAPIDISSGTLGKAFMRTDNEIRRVAHHPDSGKAIEGVGVPGWHRTVDELLALATRLPYTPCVGWDLVKLQQGWVCLEGNPEPGYHVWQVHGGVLKDPRARRFYQTFGMLK